MPLKSSLSEQNLWCCLRKTKTKTNWKPLPEKIDPTWKARRLSGRPWLRFLLNAPTHQTFSAFATQLMAGGNMRQTCRGRAKRFGEDLALPGTFRGREKSFCLKSVARKKEIEFRDQLVATPSWQLDSHLSQLQTQNLSHSSLWRKSVFLANFQLALELNPMA